MGSNMALGPDIAPLNEVKVALSDPSTYVLDVRTSEEIAASGKVNHKNWSRLDGTPDSCPELETHPERYVKDKDATVVVYCRSGRRAARAKQALIAQGYTGVILNAGGYDSLKSIL
jgi:phage shock protein E